MVDFVDYNSRLRNAVETYLSRDVNGDILGVSSDVLFPGHIKDWDVSRVTDMSSLFDGNTSFNADISGWDTSKVVVVEECTPRASCPRPRTSPRRAAGPCNLPRLRPPPAHRALPRPALRAASAERPRAERRRAQRHSRATRRPALPKRLQQRARGVVVRLVVRLLRGGELV